MTDPRILELVMSLEQAHASGSAAKMQPAIRMLLDRLADGDVQLVIPRELRSESRVERDGPKRMRARFASQCNACGGPINVDDPILYQREPRRVAHEQCPGLGSDHA